MTPRPPGLARLLARLVTPSRDRDFVTADLEERFHEIREDRGAGAARRWYWWQALRGVPANLLGAGARVAGAPPSRGELGQALRGLTRRPLYAAGVAGTMALGLGSAAAVASVAWTVWLAPMPYPDPDRVVRLYEILPPRGSPQLAPGHAEGGVPWRLSPPLLEDMRAHDWTTVEAVAGVSGNEVDWTREGGTVRLTAVLASPEIGGILGLRPVVGRTLGRDPDAPEVVLTPALWERAFGGDPAVVGATMTLDGTAHRVAGVAALPAGYPREADLLLPLHFTEAQLVEGMRGARYLDAVARVAPGHDAAEADAEVAAFVRALGKEHPQHAGHGGRAVVLGEDLVRPFTGVLALLLAAGATFLALALVNVAGLVAARRVEGRADRWVRLALGATRGRLLRDTLVEGLLLGGVAALAGLLGAYLLLAPLRAIVPADIPRIEGLGLHPPVALTVLLGGLAGGLLVGALGHALTRSGGPERGRRERTRSATAPGLAGRRLLVVGQVALTTILATGGVVILRHVASLQEVELGFEPRGVVSTQLVLSEGRYPTDESRATFWRRLLEGLEARGLTASVAVNPPMSGSTMSFGVRRDAASDQTFVQNHSVSPGYFRILGIDILEGRALEPGDGPGDAPVVVLDRTLAEALFPEGSALGREIVVVGTPRTVVGIATGTRHFGPDAEPPPSMYVPLAQDPWQLGHVLLSGARSDAAALLASVAAEVDPEVALPPLAPYTRHLDEWYAPLRLQTVIVGILALVGGLLAALGLYALVAYHVTSRRKEIGIRMALGAPGGRLFRRVLGQGLGLAVAGVVLGVGGWYALLPLTRRLMEGVEAGGAEAPALVAALLGAVAVVATLLPAWRSTAVDPVTTLAAE